MGRLPNYKSLVLPYFAWPQTRRNALYKSEKLKRCLINENVGVILEMILPAVTATFSITRRRDSRITDLVAFVYIALAHVLYPLCDLNQWCSTFFDLRPKIYFC